jgi:hypothetical protein
MYMHAGLWEKARAVGTSSGPPLQQVRVSELQCVFVYSSTRMLTVVRKKDGAFLCSASLPDFIF